MIRWFVLIVLCLATCLVAMIDISGRYRDMTVTIWEDRPTGHFLGIQAGKGVCNVLYARPFEQTEIPRFSWQMWGLKVRQMAGAFRQGGECGYEPEGAVRGYARSVFVQEPGLPPPPTFGSLESEIFVFTLPILFLLASFTLLLLSPPLFRFARRWHRKRNGRCLDCGYSVIGNVSGVCPECGTAISPLKPKAE